MGQVFPHAPQLLLSALRREQVPLQKVKPAWQEVVWPAAKAPIVPMHNSVSTDNIIQFICILFILFSPLCPFTYLPDRFGTPKTCQNKYAYY